MCLRHRSSLLLSISGEDVRQSIGISLVLTLVRLTVRELWPALLTFLLMKLVLLLGLGDALLLGALVNGGTEVLEGTDEMDSQITLGFVGLLDGLSNALDSTGEAFEGGVDRLEAVGDALEKFCI